MGNTQTQISRGDGEPMHDLTVLVPMSRHHGVAIVADQIRKQETKLKIKTFLLVDNTRITPSHIQNHFTTLDYQMVYTGQIPAGEMNINSRRQHIVDTLNLGRQQTINSDYIMILEDDSILKPNTIEQLYEHRHDGIISGIQAGRHHYKICGAWTIKPDLYETIPYKPVYDEPQKVDATGLYCLIQPTKQYLDTPFHHNPDSPVGPDVTYTQQHNPMVLWQQTIGHQTPQGTIWPDQLCQQIRFEQNIPGHWELKEL